MPLVQKDYYSTQEALERVRLALPLEDAEQNLIEVLALGKCTAWFIDQAGERFDIPTELWEALLNHRSIDRTYNVLNVDWETGEVLCLGRYEGDSDSIASRGHRGLLRFDCGQLDSVVKPGTDRPSLLFPEGRETPSPASIVHPMQSKGGRTPRATTVALIKALQTIQDSDEIVGHLTSGKLIAWFKDAEVTEENPRDIHDDFKKAYIVGRKTIVWKDRKGNQQGCSLERVRHYYRDLTGR